MAKNLSNPLIHLNKMVIFQKDLDPDGLPFEVI